MKDNASSYTYVILKNDLRPFVITADLRTQVFANLYGVSLSDNKQVKEIKAVDWIPQLDTNSTLELPSQLSKDDFLDLEPSSWIKSQALEVPHLSPLNVMTQAKMTTNHPEWGSSSICITCSFSPGFVSLSAHSLTLDTPLQFWAELRPPAAFLIVIEVHI